MVKVYALTTCPYCKKVLKFFKENGIEPDVLFIDELKEGEREEAMKEVFKLAGVYAVPVTVHGDKVIVGFKEGELKRLVEEISNDS